MTYHVTHRNGQMSANVPLDMLHLLYEELNHEDAEHPDVSLTYNGE